MSRLTQKLHVAECPACDTKLRFSKLPLPGDVLTCFECREQLEVVSLFPIKLDWSYKPDETGNDDAMWKHIYYDDDWNDTLEAILG